MSLEVYHAIIFCVLQVSHNVVLWGNIPRFGVFWQADLFLGSMKVGPTDSRGQDSQTFTLPDLILSFPFILYHGGNTTALTALQFYHDILIYIYIYCT